MSPKLQDRLVSMHQKLVDLLHLPFRRKLRQRGLDPFHKVGQEFNQLVSSLTKPRMLEIGSRNVTGTTLRHLYPNVGEYVGFDIHPGEGVDVVGDAHRLGDYFPPGHFLVVLAVSTFEHLLFPWKVVLELNKVMRVGGIMLVVTHPTWPAHELPWDFWRFPKGGFTGLFNSFTGFEIRNCEEGLPALAYSLSDDPPTRGLSHFLLKQGVSVIAVKTGEYRSDLLKWDLDAAAVTATMYPAPAR